MSRSCPICPQPRPLRVIRLHGVELETCGHCQGHWLGSLELRQLARGWKPQAVQHVLHGAPRRCPHARHRVPTGKEHCGLCGAPVVRCPSCAEPLSQVQTQVCALDVCGQCQGLWLDVGELKSLREHRHAIVPLAAGAAAAAALALASASSSLDPQRSRAGQVLTDVADRAGSVVESVSVGDVVELAVDVATELPVVAAVEVAAEGASVVGNLVATVMGGLLESLGELFN